MSKAQRSQTFISQVIPHCPVYCCQQEETRSWLLLHSISQYGNIGVSQQLG
jgi:hypothetical protein